MKNMRNKSSRYLTVSFVILALLLTSCSSVLRSEDTTETTTLQHTFFFSEPEIYTTQLHNQAYDQIDMPNAEETGNIGEPNIPRYGVSILLPHGSAIVDITVQPGKKISLGSGYCIAPIEQPRKLSEDSISISQTKKDSSIYSSEKVFPDAVFSTVGTYSYRGYSILVLLLHPIQYHPLTGELSYYTDMTVILHTEHTGILNPLFRNYDTDRNEITQKVDVLDALSSYIKVNTASRNIGKYTLLILTTDELKQGFIPLKEAHEQQGLPTEIKTLNDISSPPGQVTPEAIREYIKNEYINNGIEYVLLGGDSDIIPAKMLYAQAADDSDVMPSDLYYGCLDGTYNYNGNENWGEPHDGDDGGDVDLMAEVYVGRSPVGNLAETNNFVQKTISYIHSGGYASGPVLMAGEFLWDDPMTFGDESMEELVNGSQANMYKTVGIPLASYTFQRLYDHSWPGFNPQNPKTSGWPSSEIISVINNGVLFINHLGHSDTTYNMKLVPNDIEHLTNTILPLIYSQGCYAGSFDQGDSMAEYYTVKTTHAAFAAVLCARYGWGVPGSTNGPNQRFHRQFWDAVYGEKITQIGKVNQDSKEDNIKIINGPCIRWCYYQMNLFGDPTLQVIPDSNTPPETPARPEGESSGSVNQQYIFTTSTSDREGDKIYYKWSFGNQECSDWLGPYSAGEEASVSYEWLKRGTYEIKVKARDEHRAESNWSDPLSVTMPYISQYPILEQFILFLERCFPRLSILFNKLIVEK